MIYRHHLIAHFDWLAGSEYFDEMIDEALVAIAFTAHGHDTELVELGAAWMTANGIVQKFNLESFVKKARDDLL